MVEMNMFIADVGEFSTMKEFMETNSEMVKQGNTHVKAVDCKLVSVLLDEVTRYSSISKVQDDNYVFIRRAHDVKSGVKMNKRKAERADVGEELS